MKWLLLLSCVVLLASAVRGNLDDDWKAYKLEYNKVYNSPEEDEIHRSIYIESLKFVKEQNEKYDKKESSWKAGINELSDMTEEEIRTQKLGYKPK